MNEKKEIASSKKIISQKNIGPNHSSSSIEPVIYDKDKDITPKNKKNISPRLLLVILIICLTLSVIIFLAASFLNSKNTQDEEALIQQRHIALTQTAVQEAKQRMKKMLDEPISDKSSTDQKTNYYNELLTLLAANSDIQNTAKIYLEKIKPQAVVVGLDEKDWIATSLKYTGHAPEAKLVYLDIISELNNSIKAADPQAASETKLLINEYNEQLKIL